MKVLLDTHTFLWWLSSPDQLTASAEMVISNPANEVWVSVISLWEISIKRAIGKLQAPVNLQTDVLRAGFNQLQLSVSHIIASEQLPMLQRESI